MTDGARSERRCDKSFRQLHSNAALCMHHVLNNGFVIRDKEFFALIIYPLQLLLRGRMNGFHYAQTTFSYIHDLITKQTVRLCLCMR